MGNVGVTEILLIALVALLLFGAGRIADIGKGLGQGIKNFKQGLKEADEIDAERKPGSGAADPASGKKPDASDRDAPAAKQA
jgi:sec-independent protein translocase protein TatA